MDVSSEPEWLRFGIAAFTVWVMLLLNAAAMLGVFLESKELVKSFSVAVMMLVLPLPLLPEIILRLPEFVVRFELVIFVSLAELMLILPKLRVEEIIVSFCDSRM